MTLQAAVEILVGNVYIFLTGLVSSSLACSLYTISVQFKCYFLYTLYYEPNLNLFLSCVSLFFLYQEVNILSSPTTLYSTLSISPIVSKENPNLFPPNMDDSKKLLKSAKDYFEGGYHVKALKIIEESSSSVQGEDTEVFDHLEGEILADLGKKSGNRALKFTYLLGSVESFSRIESYPLYSANALFDLANQYESVVYYKKALRHAQKSLNFLELMMTTGNSSSLPDLPEDMAFMKFIVETVEAKIASPVPEISVGPPLKRCCIGQVRESEDNERLRSYWLGLDAESKRNFMKVRIAEFETHVQAKTGGLKALQKVLKYVKKNQNWIAWLCRTCGTKFSTADECKDHLEQEHVAGLKASSRKPQKISDVWADKIRLEVGNQWMR